jgi:hypothetical protein
VPIVDSALLSAKLVKYATLKVYKGYSHGITVRTAGSLNSRNDGLKTWNTPDHEEQHLCIRLR